MTKTSFGQQSHTSEWKDGIEYVHVPVLVIGAGAAGARVAIELQENGIEPLVVSKRSHGDAHTTWARGGVNAALGNLDPEDSPVIHAADTLDEGHYINDPVAVELVCERMPARIKELQDWGMEFNVTEEGKVNQRYFGAQSFRRTCFAGDHTGESMLDALISKAQELSTPYRDNVMVTRLLKSDGRVEGATAFDMEDGHKIVFAAGEVVLAAGGSTAIYNRHSSREEENNGDGMALAFDAGAQLMDCEFVQFHPTGMVGDRYGEEWDGRLVTEAVRGEGGKLFNSDGERFMREYSPDQMELDARDVVARAIEAEIEAGRGTENGGVYLDISHRDEEFIKERLPRMYARFQKLDVDISREPMEVAPTAHYTMGGVKFDAETGKTGVDGLRVVGETTAGVHGANRLGGNSLAETVAVGTVVGERMAEEGVDTPEDVSKRAIDEANAEFRRLDQLEQRDAGEDVFALIGELGDIMEAHAGIRRERESLQEGLERLQSVWDRVDRVAVSGGKTSEEFEFAVALRFMCRSAHAVLIGAFDRMESRGAHFRTDFMEKDSDQRYNLLYEREGLGVERSVSEVGVPSEKVQEAIDEGHELDYHHLE